MKILVVDDEPLICDLLSAALRFEGFHVEVATTGRDALQMVEAKNPDIVLLDVMLPDIEGTLVAKQLREAGCKTPILFLTARDATEDKVAGLSVADDYVTKPFSLDELVARIYAVLRRGSVQATGRLEFADLVMDPETREVWRHGNEIGLTATEFNVLEYLMLNARRVVPKSEILEHVWEYGSTTEENIVETYISYLRKKVDEWDPPLIHTVRRVGYSLRLPK